MFHKDCSGDPETRKVLLFWLAEDLLFFSLEAADNKARPGLRLEPGRFRWHDEVGVGNVKEFIDCAGVHGDSSDAVGLTAADKLGMTTDATNEVDPVVTLDIFDAKDLFEDELVDNLGIKLGDGRAKVDFIGFYGHRVPPAVYVETVVVLCLDSGSFSIGKRAQSEVLL